MADSIINTGGTNKLADDNTFCAVNNEGSCLSHQGQIAHEDFMLCNLFFFFIVKTYLNF